MKITKTASGKKEIRMSKQEWETVGKKAGWIQKETGAEGHLCKDTRKLLKELMRQGFRVQPTRNGYTVYAPDGVNMYQVHVGGDSFNPLKRWLRNQVGMKIT